MCHRREIISLCRLCRKFLISTRFANPENLLYAPEIKFYSNQVVIDEKFETSIKGLYSIGDGGGMTRGLMMASASGVQMARNLCE